LGVGGLGLGARDWDWDWGLFLNVFGQSTYKYLIINILYFFVISK
jgi:hypothetical protein